MTDESKPSKGSVMEALPGATVMTLLPKNNGISKREHYAALILAGINANPDPQFAQLTHIEMIERSIEQADLLIEMFARADREDTADDEAIGGSTAADQLANLVR